MSRQRAGVAATQEPLALAPHPEMLYAMRRITRDGRSQRRWLQLDAAARPRPTREPREPPGAALLSNGAHVRGWLRDWPQDCRVGASRDHDARTTERHGGAVGPRRAGSDMNKDLQVQGLTSQTTWHALILRPHGDGLVTRQRAHQDSRRAAMIFFFLRRTPAWSYLGASDLGFSTTPFSAGTSWPSA